MRELLERLKDAMPTGWELLQHTQGADWWSLVEEAGAYDGAVDAYTNIYSYTDIGLAPLTALLKQELGDKKDNRLAIHRCRYNLPIPPGTERDLWEVVVPHDGDFHHFDTEFEAVAHVYLSLRPKEARKRAELSAQETKE